MGLMSSSVHVGNGSNMTIRARVAQEETHIKEIEASLGINGGPPFSLDASLKAKLDYSLDVTGFARIAPQEGLEFGLAKGSRKPIFVSVTSADEKSPLIICFNYSPPHKKSVIITTAGTVTLSEKQLPKNIPVHQSKSSIKKTNKIFLEKSTSIRDPYDGRAPPPGPLLGATAVYKAKRLSKDPYPVEEGKAYISKSNDILLSLRTASGTYSIAHAVERDEEAGSYRIKNELNDLADGRTVYKVAERQDEIWKTDEGQFYSTSMAKKVYLQTDIDDQARRLRLAENIQLESPINETSNN